MMPAEENRVAEKHAALVARGVVLARDGQGFARLPDITAGANQSIAIVGPSGCGKTTALLALAGIRAPMHGEIFIDGTDVWAQSSASRDRFRGRKIGLVFQSFHLIDALSVAANLRLAARCAGYSDAEPGRVAQLMSRLSIDSEARKRADRISHGQAQRVAVARALVNKPAVVLADEPTSALDDDNARAMLGLLKEQARTEQAALVIATHDRRVLDAVDAVIRMEPMS